MERMDAQIRTLGANERSAARAVSPNPRAPRDAGNSVEQLAGGRDEHVTRVGARQIGGDRQARVFVSRHVLRAVHRNIDFPRDEGSLDRRDERAFAPRRVRRPTIAFGGDCEKSSGHVGAAERLDDDRGLGQRQPAAACPNPQCIDGDCHGSRAATGRSAGQCARGSGSRISEHNRENLPKSMYRAERASEP